MPYIPEVKRPMIDSALIGLTPKDEGELNYTISKLLHQFITRQGSSYRTYNTVIGLLDCVKLEIYRTTISPYEDRKRLENGDVL